MTGTKNRRGEVRVNPSRMAAYAASGAAASFGAASVSNAAITYVDLTPDVVIADIAVGGGGVGTNFLFDTHNLTLAHGLGTTNAATGYAFAGGELLATPGVQIAGFTAGAYNYARNLAYGANIAAEAFLAANAIGTLAYNGGYGGDEFLSAGQGFLGVRFSGNRYGWVRVQMNGAPLNTYSVLDYAYGDPGDLLTAGAIPEPTSLATLALGAAGLAAWRGRRQQAA
ncbi:MAG TPA: PEP-CTERM sorting domain-containing protein [Tepidisphaeraceae bacterium]|nr:PEP-CTERM sorting domain-containing protein [Tepidisphaeraceae bacterium]